MSLTICIAIRFRFGVPLRNASNIAVTWFFFTFAGIGGS